jgi:hypothetical protein
MAEEGRNLSLVILGIVAIIAVVGLVLLLSGGKATKTGNILNVPSLDGLPGCDSPCTPGLLGPYDENSYQYSDENGDFRLAFGQKCYVTGYEDPRYPGSGPLHCCCPTVGGKSVLVGDQSLVRGPPFNDHVTSGDGLINDRDSRLPVMGGYEIER